MAIALVKVGTVATGTSPQQPAFGQATGTGNLLIAWVADDTAIASVSVDQSWVLALRSTAAGGFAGSSIWYKQNSAAGETAPTFTATGHTLWAALAEFSGAATSFTNDQIGAVEFPVAPTSPQSVTAAAPDAASGELVVTASLWTLTKAGTVTTADTYNNGATPTTNLNNDATSSALHYRFAWGTTTGNSVANNVSETNNSKNIGADGGLVIASFKLAPVVVVQPVAKQIRPNFIYLRKNR